MTTPPSPATDPRAAERAARVSLAMLAEPGDLRLAVHLDRFGPVRLLAALREGRTEDERIRGLVADAALRAQQADGTAELERAARLGIRFVIPGDDEWPAQLDQLAVAGQNHERGGLPLGLWVRGPLPLRALEGSVALVGSRSSTGYGEQTAGDIAAVVARAGRVVVSGGAFGIDQAAHRGAIGSHAPTVAVLACGADRVYPRAHSDLLEHIAQTGAVVSEVPLGAAPLRHRFLARNRLIAALTRGTVVVEAAQRSGALNTATWATRLNRVLMGVPGPVSSAASGGVHRLLRDGRAVLVCDGKDVLESVGSAGEHLVEEVRNPDTGRDALPRRTRQVLDAVPVVQGASSTSVARTAGIELLAAQQALLDLEARGFVERGEAGWRLSEREVHAQLRATL